jgi:hypothetical protein
MITWYNTFCYTKYSTAAAENSDIFYASKIQCVHKVPPEFQVDTVLKETD